MQIFQLIHAVSYCAHSVGVHFVGICARFRTRINKKQLKQLNFDPSNYEFIVHVAMVMLVNNLLSICHIVNW